jgi:hypothetical protein
LFQQRTPDYAQNKTLGTCRTGGQGLLTLGIVYNYCSSIR